MLQYNEIKEKKFIILDDEPYEVLSSHVFRKQQRKPVNATKLRHLISGSVKEHSFHVSDKVDEADIDKKQIKFLYRNKGENWFSDANNLAKRFSLDTAIVGVENIRFLKEGMVVEAPIFNDEIFGIDLPIKMDFVVKEAPPGIKGDSSRAGMKQVILETGATINAPLFIETGDKITVNTESGDYVGKA
ncbi:MAG: hypothetical protein COV07_03115 [Candidatus Vogelbacteria bacterium CG10_big_fil_rev_8_21_14_0_10_45_14]|uniref:Elongation factor P C-terminal domain-containing protein n=1 Tax=Candidatus Vogelbacteria bacterium CG10_big_fil_rev_8_21_14_0_10_45_14 TaxID=1975042 RepID=A0A2H0RJ94_9BACT|nr:MAG: hypothetical protein COV07_03115 [Candidatus Vogelbacteria bacterium CG10_big_fil_rev_8_21_14_0_10_45_14]